MEYHDLIQFEAAMEATQLVSANRRAAAEHVTKAYAFTDRMPEVLNHRMLPALNMQTRSIAHLNSPNSSD